MSILENSDEMKMNTETSDAKLISSVSSNEEMPPPNAEANASTLQEQSHIDSSYFFAPSDEDDASDKYLSFVDNDDEEETTDDESGSEFSADSSDIVSEDEEEVEKALRILAEMEAQEEARTTNNGNAMDLPCPSIDDLDSIDSFWQDDAEHVGLGSESSSDASINQIISSMEKAADEAQRLETEVLVESRQEEDHTGEMESSDYNDSALASHHEIILEKSHAEDIVLKSSDEDSSIDALEAERAVEDDNLVLNVSEESSSVDDVEAERDVDYLTETEMVLTTTDLESTVDTAGPVNDESVMDDIRASPSEEVFLSNEEEPGRIPNNEEEPGQIMTAAVENKESIKTGVSVDDAELLAAEEAAESLLAAEDEGRRAMEAQKEAEEAAEDSRQALAEEEARKEAERLTSQLAEMAEKEARRMIYDSVDEEHIKEVAQGKDSSEAKNLESDVMEVKDCAIENTDAMKTAADDAVKEETKNPEIDHAVQKVPTDNNGSDIFDSRGWWDDLEEPEDTNTAPTENESTELISKTEEDENKVASEDKTVPWLETEVINKDDPAAETKDSERVVRNINVSPVVGSHWWNIEEPETPNSTVNVDNPGNADESSLQVPTSQGNWWTQDVDNGEPTISTSWLNKDTDVDALAKTPKAVNQKQGAKNIKIVQDDKNPPSPAAPTVARNSSNDREDSEKSISRTGAYMENSRKIQFRDPYPLPPPPSRPRSPATIVKAHSLPAKPLAPKWKKPSAQLKELIEAAKGASLSRRSNACGALKVLCLKKKNQLNLARTSGVLDALISAALHNPDRNSVVGNDARTRAVTAIQYMASPMDNRVLILQNQSLLQCLIKVIKEDKQEARVVACCALALLAKTGDNRHNMATTGELVGVLAKTVGGVYETPNTGKLTSTSFDSSVSGDSFQDDRDDYDKYSQNADPSTQRDEGTVRHDKTEELLLAARSNACAVLMHLAKDCASSSTLCENQLLVSTLVEVSEEFQLPFHTKCIEILCNFSRFPANNSSLAANKELIETLIKCSASKFNEDRLWAMRALQNLTSDENSKVALATPSLLSALSVSARSDEPDEQLAAVAALVNLSGEPGTIVPFTNTKNVVSTLVHLAHSSTSSPTVKAISCDALAATGLWLQTLAGVGTVPEGMDKVLLPTQVATGWQRWD